MLILALGSVVVGCAFLVVSFLTENTGWAWGCIAACGVAAILLLVDTVRRNRVSGDTTETAESHETAKSPETAKAAGAAKPAERSTETAASAAAQPVEQRAAAESGTAQSSTAQGPDQPTEVLSATAPVEEPAPAEHKPGWRDRRKAAKQEQADRDEKARLAAAAREERARDRAAQAREQQEKDSAAQALLGATAVQPAVTDADVAVDDDREPDEEDVDAADILVVGGQQEEVLVIDERPRFHLETCPWLRDKPTLSLPVAEAMELGFTGCARCTPSRVLAAQARER